MLMISYLHFGTQPNVVLHGVAYYKESVDGIHWKWMMVICCTEGEIAKLQRGYM